MGRALSLGLALGIVAVASIAAADDAAVKAAPNAAVERGPTTVATVTVHGRPARPNSAITVGRVPLDLTVRALKQPLVDRIGKSADKPPF